MKVIAAKGTRCPKEENPRQYITDDVPVDVLETAYYKRLIADGSLVVVSSTEQTEQAEIAIVSESKQSKRGGKE